MIDFHRHLDLYPDPRLAAREAATSCQFVLSVTTTPSAFDVTAQIGRVSDNIETAIGMHPELVAQRYQEMPLFERLLDSTKFVGEIGIDGSPALRGSWQKQCEVFSTILGLCRDRGGRILSIHSRRAADEVCIRLTETSGFGTAILHWFSGSLKDLRRASDIGCYFSVGPPMVKSKSGLKIVSEVPRDRLLTETDGPFVQVDNSPAEGAHIAHVLSEIAVLWGTTMENVASRIVANANRIFKEHGLERRIP